MAALSFLSDGERWNAVRNRDPMADGSFVYCVRTTKIYCRPTCKARLARRSNVEFFTTVPEAVEAGYRACKRCKPELIIYIPEAEQSIFRIRTLLEKLPAGAPLPKLEVLASEAGLTKYHFHRSFKKATGSTPRDYALSRRRMRLMGGVEGQPESRDGTNVSTPSLSTESATVTGSAETPDPVQLDIFDVGDWAMDDFDDAFLFNDSSNFDFDTQAGNDFNATMYPVPAEDLLPKEFNNSPGSIQMHYSMVSTANGALIMAFEGTQLRKMEFGASAVDILTSLRTAYPFPAFILSPVEELAHTERQAIQQHVAAVAAALDQPQERVVDWQLPHNADFGAT